jgi:hypothetical protein
VMLRRSIHQSNRLLLVVLTMLVTALSSPLVHASAAPIQHGDMDNRTANCLTLCSSTRTYSQMPTEVRVKRQNKEPEPVLPPYYVLYSLVPSENVGKASDYPGAKVLRPPDLIKLHATYRF